MFHPCSIRGSLTFSLALASSIVCGADNANDWPRFLGPTADSRSAETGIVTTWGPCGPLVVWQRRLGSGYGIGSVANGRFYQPERQGDRNRLLCFDSRTGRPIWTFEYKTDYEDMLGYNDGPRSTPLIDGDCIYLFGQEGMLHCLRADDGRVLWKIDTVEKYGVVQNFFGVGTSPVVEGDLLIVMIGGSPAESQSAGRFDLDRVKANGSGIVAFDKRTGAERYRITDELASYTTPQLATIRGRRWCFVFARGGLVAFDPATGKVDFHYPWRARLRDSVNAASPIVVGDEVLISECYGPGTSLLRVRPGAYDIVWRDGPGRDKSLLLHWNTPVYHEGYAYGSSGRHSGEAELRCVQWKTGRVMWRKPGLRRASLLYIDGHFVCLSEDGVLRLIKATPDAYQLVAEGVIRETPDSAPLMKPPAWAAPIISHGLLYLRSENRLVCLKIGAGG